MMKKKFIFWLCAIICISSIGPATSATSGKKIIEAGWDGPDAATLRKNLSQMEETPFDGVFVVVDGTDDNGQSVSVRGAFSNKHWKKEWFQSEVDNLKAIHSTKLTDNFLMTGANPGNVDWFDDSGWKEIVDHYRIAAWIAKEGHLKGILFDPEGYTKPYRLFRYDAQAEYEQHSFAEYQLKARQRGKEIINAVAEVDPKLMFFTFFMNSRNEVAANANDPQVALQNNDYGLYPAFINGWLDAAPPSMIFVDGTEYQGYRANSAVDFLQAADFVRNASLRLVAPENHQKYLSQVQMSFGIYLDSYRVAPSSAYYIDPEDTTRTKRLGINVRHAIDAASEYIWIYGEKYRWWPTKNKNVKAQYWRDILPGIEQELKAAVDPLLIAQQKLANLQENGTLVNLVKNGNFTIETSKNASAEKATADWKTVGAPRRWYTWQPQKSTGIFAQDNIVNHGNEKSGSVRIAGANSGSVIQKIDVKPGKTYLVRAWTRQVGSGRIVIRVRWKNPQDKWVKQMSDKMIYGSAGVKEGEWQQLEEIVTVPHDANQLILLLAAGAQPTDQDIVWYDDVEIYEIP